MLHTPELFTMARDLAHRKVLSIYVNRYAADPAERYTWHTALAADLRTARDAVTDSAEREEFDRATAMLQQVMPALGTTGGGPGWAGFATSDGVVAVSDLPRRAEPLVAWQHGAVIGQYLRALKHERPVIVALVQPRGALLYRYAHGTLEALESVNLGMDGETRIARQRGRNERGAGQRRPRAALKTEVSHQRQLAQLHRVASSLVPRLRLLAPTDACIVIAGAPQSTAVVLRALPGGLRRRSIVTNELNHTAASRAIIRVAKRAARELRSRRGQEVISRILGRAGYRAAAGVPALQRALYASAVDHLFVSPRFLHVDREWAERSLHAALAQGANVEVLSGDAGMLLDRLAGGVAARLRFAIEPKQDGTPSALAVSPMAPRAS